MKLTVGKATTVITGALVMQLALVSLVSLFTMSISSGKDIYASSTSHGIAGINAQLEGFTSGTIASLQNDKNRNPIWVVSGLWNTTLVDELLPAQTNVSNLGPSFFNASFDMVMTNGSARHTHTVTDFSERESSSSDKNMTLVFNGTSTVSMEEGPVEKVPTIITILDGNIMSLWLNPRNTENHFGDTPIFGIIMTNNDNNAPP
jgi:hypothetical protein